MYIQKHQTALIYTALSTLRLSNDIINNCCKKQSIQKHMEAISKPYGRLGQIRDTAAFDMNDC